jgi:hypothetical protein
VVEGCRGGSKPARQTKGIDHPPIVDTQDPYGYVSPRAPYLHNGSVSTLRDLLNPPAERPQTFHRSYDVFDPVNVGSRNRRRGQSGQMASWSNHILFLTREKTGTVINATRTAPNYRSRIRRDCSNI